MTRKVPFSYVRRTEPVALPGTANPRKNLVTKPVLPFNYLYARPRFFRGGEMERSAFMRTKLAFIFALSAAAIGVQSQTVTFASTAEGDSTTDWVYNSTPFENRFAGKLNFSDPGDTTGLGTAFKTVCVDLENAISAGNSWQATISLSSSLTGGLELAGRIVGTYFNAATTDGTAKQLQLAVWEAVYDGVANGGSADFSGGVFTSDEATATGDTYYSAVSTHPWAEAFYIAPTGGDKGQAQMTPTPEPATLAVLGVGAIAALRKRRKA